MLSGASQEEIVTSVAQLREYLLAGAKPVSGWRLGIEHEKLAVRSDGRPVPFGGDHGIEALLAAMTGLGFEPRKEDGRIIALRREGLEGDRVTLEPGGQIELSAAPRDTAAGAAAAVSAHMDELAEAATGLGIGFIGGGLRPFGTLAEVPWSSKRRYVLMRRELPGRGGRAREMMQRTAAVHANLDFSGETDAFDKLRTALGVTSIVTAMMAASPIADGRPSGYRSRRAAVWLDTDESRSGILPGLLLPGAGLDDYLDWLLDVPLLFLVRGGELLGGRGATFRTLLDGRMAGQRATMADWDVHLSTVFPEVRLRQHVEMRGADSGPLPFVYAVGALWRGVLDDADARGAAAELTAGLTTGQRLELRRIVPRLGLQARVGRWTVTELARELLAIGRRGLQALPGGAEDARLLDPVEELAQVGLCPADLMLRDLEECGGDAARLVERWSLVKSRGAARI